MTWVLRRKVSNFRARRCLLILAAFFLLDGGPGQASDIRVYLLGPQPPKSLNTIESQGSDAPIYQHSYSIPYATVEAKLRAAAKQKIDFDSGDQTEDCPSVCPDVHWHATVTSDVSFIEKPQPQLTKFGDTQTNGIDVVLKDAILKLHLDLHADMWIILGEGRFSTKVSGSTNIPIDLLIAVNAASKLNVWPELVSAKVPCEVTALQETVCVSLTLKDSNINLSDPKGIAIGIGTALGGIIGSTQVGGMLGDPLAALVGGDLGAKISEYAATEAANIAESKIKAEADKALNEILKIASLQATTLASTYLDAKVLQASQLKNALLTTKLPQINKSYQDFISAFGFSIDIQTPLSNGNLYVLITPRFAGNAGGGKLVGKLRMPKEACVYMEWKMGTLPMGLVSVEANQDLPGKVGTTCTTIVPTSEIKSTGYLGADPNLLKVGATSMPNWKPVGSINLTGTLSVVNTAKPSIVGSAFTAREKKSGLHSRTPTGYYECGLEITGVPSADIVELTFKGQAAARIPGYFQTPYRFLEVSGAGTSATIVDAGWKLTPPPLIFGGEGQCTRGTVSAPHYEASAWLDRIKDLFDPDKCPNCDIQLSEGMLKIRNSNPVLENPSLKPMFQALENGKPLPTSVQDPVGQAPAARMETTTGSVQQKPKEKLLFKKPGSQGFQKPH